VSALAIAAAVAMANACAPQVAPETLISVARVESGLDPLAIRDNTTVALSHPADAPTAALIAATLIHDGHSVDLGLMQINSANLAALHMTVLGAFDACTSMRAGATVLENAYAGGSTQAEQQHELRVALSRYNTGGATQGFANGYVHRVELVAERLVPTILASPYADPPAPAPTPQPRAAPSWDVWGDDPAPPTMRAPVAPPPTGDTKATPAELQPGQIKRTS
jgi:type IV secretion system protein VirB1